MLRRVLEILGLIAARQPAMVIRNRDLNPIDGMLIAEALGKWKVPRKGLI
jgi:hypothetical protein